MKRYIHLFACAALFMGCNLPNGSSIVDAEYEVNIYDGHSPYCKKDFKFNDMTFMLPKTTFEDDLIFFAYPNDLQEKDMQILQEDIRYHVDLDSNPILFF